MTLDEFRTEYYNALHVLSNCSFAEEDVDFVISLRENYPEFYAIVRKEIGVDDEN